MRLLFLFLTIFIAVPVFSQFKHDYVWLLGTQGNPPSGLNSRFGIDILDFNNGTLEVTRDILDVEFFLTNASICDSNGNLLFYSNGCKVFNREGSVMDNGHGLNPGAAYLTGNCPDEGNPIPKGLIILPLPEDPNKFYAFHLSAEYEEMLSIHAAKLYYSVVDMELNGGLGKVIEKNEVILADTLFADLHAVRHANGEDWWIMVSKEHRNLFYKVLFTKDGVAGVFEQEIGIDPNPFHSAGGTASFSPDGTMYARYYLSDQVLLYDFDRSTGQLSNFRQLYADTTQGSFGALSFSASSRFLYATTRTTLWQFDLHAPDVQASKVLVGEYDGYLYQNFFQATFSLMQLAPDCKIYMTTRNSSDVLHVIHSPDEPGLACNFVQREFKLPAVNTASIPNFPNYRLGTGYPVCDSSIQLVVSSVQVQAPAHEVQVWPNPATNQVQVEWGDPLIEPGTWSLYNSVGQRVVYQAVSRGETGLVVELKGVPSGFYFWEMRGEGRRFGGGKLVVRQ